MTSLALRRNAVRICPANTLAPLLVLSLLPPLRSAGAECGATCGGPLTADRESEGYSGSCWENDLIMAIPLLECARLAMPCRAPRPSEGCSWPAPVLLVVFFGLSLFPRLGVPLVGFAVRAHVCALAAPQGCRGGGG